MMIHHGNAEAEGLTSLLVIVHNCSIGEVRDAGCSPDWFPCTVQTLTDVDRLS
jgi:hypothetical protein